MIQYVTSLPLSTRHRISQLLFHKSRSLLAVQSHEKTVEIFRIRTEDEIQKKRARRKKREREKAKAKPDGNKKNGKTFTETVDEMDVDNEVADVSLVDLFTPYLVVRASGKIRSFAFSDDERDTKGGTQVRTIQSKILHPFIYNRPSFDL